MKHRSSVVNSGCKATFIWVWKVTSLKDATWFLGQEEPSPLNSGQTQQVSTEHPGAAVAFASLHQGTDYSASKIFSHQYMALNSSFPFMPWLSHVFPEYKHASIHFSPGQGYPSCSRTRCKTHHLPEHKDPSLFSPPPEDNDEMGFSKRFAFLYFTM